MKKNRGEITTLMVAMMVVMVGVGLIFSKKCGMMGMHGLKQNNHANNNVTSAEYTYAKDPVCGMEVEISTSSIRTNWRNKTYYFCSKEDKENFELHPNKYAK
ncbi:MAG: hypothetical protein A3J83_02250 [Elusimicrobia bacterium RIFOXYA2_FULL_40_6]|nr:MAG: hypothetical protein A3J83_02250 [Elusimicrobia bacterium RIFOXYA2_FULL_40_6]